MGKEKERAHIVHMRDGERRQWRGGSGFVVAHGGERRADGGDANGWWKRGQGPGYSVNYRMLCADWGTQD